MSQLLQLLVHLGLVPYWESLHFAPGLRGVLLEILLLASACPLAAEQEVTPILILPVRPLLPSLLLLRVLVVLWQKLLLLPVVLTSMSFLEQQLQQHQLLLLLLHPFGSGGQA